MPFGEDIFQNVGARTASLSYSTSQDDIRQKFTGYQKDSETQLDFAEARMYENRFGRFTAVDPLLASGRSANPQTFNRFVYVGNNPIMITDPTGLKWYRQKNGDRWTYQDWDDDPGEGWESVDFGSMSNRLLKLDDVCVTSACNSTVYLNRYGGVGTADEYNRQMLSFTPPAFSINNGMLYVGNPADLPNALFGAKTSLYNMVIGLANSPLEAPMYPTNPLLSGLSLGDILGKPRFFEYAEYENDRQRMYGIQTQVGVTAATIFSGGWANVGRVGRISSLATMDDAYNAAGTVRNIAGYDVGGTFGKVGNSYNVNIWGLYKADGGKGMFSFVKALQAEAAASGATQLNIVGTHIRNTNFLNPSNVNRASRFGFTYREINAETVLFSGPAK